LATTNDDEPVILPPESDIVQEGAGTEATGIPDNVQLVSLRENPVPDTRTVDPI